MKFHPKVFFVEPLNQVCGVEICGSLRNVNDALLTTAESNAVERIQTCEPESQVADPGPNALAKRMHLKVTGNMQRRRHPCIS